MDLRTALSEQQSSGETEVGQVPVPVGTKIFQRRGWGWQSPKGSPRSWPAVLWLPCQPALPATPRYVLSQNPSFWPAASERTACHFQNSRGKNGKLWKGKMTKKNHGKQNMVSHVPLAPPSLSHTHTCMQMVKINPNVTVIKIYVNKPILSIREFQICSLKCLAVLF